MIHRYIVYIFGRDGDYTGAYLSSRLEEGWEIFRCEEKDDINRPIYILRKLL